MQLKAMNRVVLTLALGAVPVFGTIGYAATQEQTEQEKKKEKDKEKQKQLETQQSQQAKQQQRVRAQEQKAQAERQERQNQEAAQQQRERDQRQKDQIEQRQERLKDQRTSQQQHELQERKRLSEQHSQILITEHRERATQYSHSLSLQEQIGEKRAAAMRQEKRYASYRYHQRYIERLHEQRMGLADAHTYDYDNDPYFYTAPQYRYSRNGRYYEANEYALDVLHKAIRYGYQEGVYAGQADREDHWGHGYRDCWAYQDANYGYTGYYVSQSDYNYYFREGFRRGYEDGWNSRYRYGRHSDGAIEILETVLSAILHAEALR